MGKSVAFTGHRPANFNHKYDLKDPIYDPIKEELNRNIEALINDGHDTFITGGALGVDMLAFFCVHKLKAKYPHIKNKLAIPFKGYYKQWKDDGVKYIKTMIKMMDEFVNVSEQGARYNSGGNVVEQLQLRNEYMIDNCDAVIAVWDGSKSGTHNCIKYAKKNNKKINYVYIIKEEQMKVIKNDSTEAMNKVMENIKTAVLCNKYEYFNEEFLAELSNLSKKHNTETVEFENTPLDKILSKLTISEIKEDRVLFDDEGYDVLVRLK